MFIHDIIKIKYTHMGYLPDDRVELISDAEMCDAFLCYDKFYNQVVYKTVIDIQHQIDMLQQRICDTTCTICEYKTQIVNMQAQQSGLSPDSNLYKELQLEIERISEIVGEESHDDPDTGTLIPATGLEASLEHLKYNLIVNQSDLVTAQEQADLDTVEFDDDFLHGKYQCYFCDTYPLIDDSLLEETATQLKQKATALLFRFLKANMLEKQKRDALYQKMINTLSLLKDEDRKFTQKLLDALNKGNQ